MMNHSLIEAGRMMGHDIRVTAAYPDRVTDLFDRPDLVILADIHNQPSARTRVAPEIIDRVIGGQPYIHLDNAYVDVCDLPYLPCNGATDGESCPHKRSIKAQAHRLFRRRGCLAARTRGIYANALMNVFVSRLHRLTVQGIVGSDAVGRFLEAPPTVDTDRFFDQGRGRDIENLYVGSICEAKGLDVLKAEFAGNITMVGPTSSGTDPGFGDWRGQLPYDDIPAYMNRARNFVFLPRWPEPCGRVAIEAALCGCNLITNENVGALGFVEEFMRQDGGPDPAGRFWREALLCLS